MFRTTHFALPRPVQMPGQSDLPSPLDESCQSAYLPGPVLDFQALHAPEVLGVVGDDASAIARECATYKPA